MSGRVLISEMKSLLPLTLSLRTRHSRDSSYTYVYALPEFSFQPCPAVLPAKSFPSIATALYRHSIIEDIYWDARQAADGQRKLFKPRNTTIDDVGVRRLFDMWTPDFNCPFYKERVGNVGDGGKWVR